jgi:HD-GYP domain-containing protein (c-di-GMP phosphodiesterase class II)
VVPAAIPLKSTTEDCDLELLASIARQTGLALQTATSYETLERTFLSTVEALANALEANDETTSSHARWITDLALKVGEELGLEPQELKRLELGALFHDIGKIGIPARILAKPGALTPDERALVETHPILGERILARSSSSGRSGSSSAARTSTTTGRATPTTCPASKSRSSRGSSSRVTPSTL